MVQLSMETNFEWCDFQALDYRLLLKLLSLNWPIKNVGTFFCETASILQNNCTHSTIYYHFLAHTHWPIFNLPFKWNETDCMKNNNNNKTFTHLGHTSNCIVCTLCTHGFRKLNTHGINGKFITFPKCIAHQRMGRDAHSLVRSPDSNASLTRLFGWFWIYLFIRFTTLSPIS